MGVEDVEVGGQVLAQMLIPRSRDLPCPLERLHEAESSRMRTDSVSTPQKTLSAPRGGR